MHELNPRPTEPRTAAYDQSLVQSLVEDPGAFPVLLRRMREPSWTDHLGPSPASWASRRASCGEYEGGRRARHGEVRLSKLVRWAHACGCELYVRFPQRPPTGSSE